MAELERALLLTVSLSLPLLAVAAVVGLVVAVLQTATQLQDATLAHLPRLVAVACALAFIGPWMARQIGSYAKHIFSMVAF